ncbi:MAG: S8 family serine peptidase [Gammaproteobacteria bacterium]|nr:S8 family serine peptidase [Gammaproteobacteria bacterium]
MKFPVAKVLHAWLAAAAAMCLCLVAADAPAEEVTDRLRAAAEAGCAPAGDGSGMGAALGGAIRIGLSPITMRGTEVGTRTRFMLKDGARIYVERFAPGGALRRLVLVYHAPSARSYRPEWMVFADGRCRVLAGRRLVYDEDGHATYLERTDPSLRQVEAREPLNPPVPDGGTSEGVPVALVDSGVNYLLDPIRRRLARRADGSLLGFDYWDMDGRPFDSNPARSPFLPQRHGTQTAGVLIEEAPFSRLVVYRYPRPDMSRMSALIEDASNSGVVIVNLSLGSSNREEWIAFEAAAKKHAHMLFIVSAGNDGRDIDADPIYPAALGLENLLTVTSANDKGVPAEGSNWGPASVDLMVPAESLVSIDFDGRPKLVSGSSYAAARVSALAACLLGAHPEWRAPELKAAILERVTPSVNDVVKLVSRGLLGAPVASDRGACAAEPAGPEVIARSRIDGATLYRNATLPENVDLVFSAALVVLAGTHWSAELLEPMARDAAQVFARCNVGISHLDLYRLRTPRRQLYFYQPHARALVRGFEVARPAVFFVRDTLQRIAFDAEAIGHANGRGRPELVDTVWMTEAVGHSGLALAHELYHVLSDSGTHSDDPANLMYPETRAGNTLLTEAQCLRMRQVGAAFGHLKPVE